MQNLVHTNLFKAKRIFAFYLSLVLFTSMFSADPHARAAEDIIAMKHYSTQDRAQIRPVADFEKQKEQESISLHETEESDVQTDTSGNNPWGITTMTDEELDLMAYLCGGNTEDKFYLALAITWQESRWGTRWISDDGHDYGFFQLRDCIHAFLQNQTGTDPKTRIGNIVCGVLQMNRCLSVTTSTRSALTLYRYGQDNGKYGYADSVLAKMQELKDQHAAYLAAVN